jgi:hypothetical protein
MTKRPIDDPVFQTPVYPWPSDCECPAACGRCGEVSGWYHDTDGARVCVDCFRRTCKGCHVVMSQHQRCTGPCE